jgi:anaerobic nitric oxide reductase flavorubredoxin
MNAEPIRISSSVHWVGVNDAETKLFEGLWEIPEGVSYNSYLVIGSEKTALIDSVLDRYVGAHLEKIRRLVDPLEIDYLVLNHMEPDHTGTAPKILEASPEAQVILTPIALNIFKHFHHQEPRAIIIKGDDTSVDLGGKTLRFIQTPWLHWPETMSTYLPDEKMVFSCDAFGSFKRLPDGLIMEANIENIREYVHKASRKYFAGVFSGQREWVLKAIKKFEDMDIKPEVLAPSHGPVYNTSAREIMSLWASWSRPDYVKSVVVAYGSMYGMTAKLVEAVVEGIEEAGGHAVVFDLSEEAPVDVLAALLDAPALMIGSPTYERDAFPKVKQFLNLMEMKKLSDRFVGLFGSFGWSGEATRKLSEQLSALGSTVVGKPLAILGTPSQEDLKKAKELAMTVAQTAFTKRGL